MSVFPAHGASAARTAAPAPVRTAVLAKIGEARALVQRVELDRAVRIYEEALRSARQNSDAFSMDELVTWRAECGSAYVHLPGRDALADAHFTAALTLRPSLRLDPDVYDPTTRERFKVSIARIQNVPRGTLSVSAQPENAKVFIDGNPAGTAPLSVPRLLPGEHYLRVEAEDYRSFQATVSVGANKVERVDVFLSRVAAPRAQPTSLPVAPSAPVTIAPIALAHPDEPRGVHPVLALMPFGIGQFAEHRHLAGALFLATEAALVIAHVTLLALVLRDRDADGFYANPERSNVLRWTANGLLITLGAEMIAGAIDGLIHRGDSP